MATNLAIDRKLLKTAVRVGGQKTKRETVNQALREFVMKREAAEIIDLFGKIEYDKDYNYKEARRSGG
jgi:Arc/MetJ family transcription regulator